MTMMWHAMCQQGVVTSSRSHDDVALISIKLHLMIGQNVHNAKTCILQLDLRNYNVQHHYKNH